MLSPMRFKYSPQIVYENFDDEVVIINLESGSYYSLDKTGAAIWGMIEGDATVGEIIEGLVRRYVGHRSEMEVAAHQFVDELRREGIIEIGVSNEDENHEVSQIPLGDHHIMERPDFHPPLIRKYTDMQELLLLDPVHEVDETGWPSKNLINA